MLFLYLRYAYGKIIRRMQTHFTPRPFPFSVVTDHISHHRQQQKHLRGGKTLVVPVVNFVWCRLWADCRFFHFPFILLHNFSARQAVNLC